MKVPAHLNKDKCLCTIRPGPYIRKRSCTATVIMQLVSYSFLNAKTTNAEDAARYKELHQRTFPETTDENAIWKNKPIDISRKLKLLQNKRMHNLYWNRQLIKMYPLNNKLKLHGTNLIFPKC